MGNTWALDWLAGWEGQAAAGLRGRKLAGPCLNYSHSLEEKVTWQSSLSPSLLV